MSYIKGSANKCSSNVWHTMDAFISVWTNWQRSKASSVHHDVIFFHGHKMASWLSTGCAMPELPGAKQAVFPGASFISKFGNFLYLEELGDTQWVLLNLPGAILNWNIKNQLLKVHEIEVRISIVFMLCASGSMIFTLQMPKEADSFPREQICPQLFLIVEEGSQSLRWPFLNRKCIVSSL